MLTRSDGSMVSLQDASRRLQIPVDVLWKWITDGRLQAEIRPGRGLGMEYYLDPRELKRAHDLHGTEIESSAEVDNQTSEPPSNVISLDFSELGSAPDQSDRGSNPTVKSDALIALENLRSEAVSSVERQVKREATISELVAAVETLMNNLIEGMDRAQDLNEGRLAAELETLRARVSRQIQEREREDLRLRDALAATKTELTSVLLALRPEATMSQQVPELTGTDLPAGEELNHVEEGASAS